MDTMVEIFGYYRFKEPLEKILDDGNGKKEYQRRKNLFVRIKAFDIQNKTFVELRLSSLEYILLMSFGQILLRDYEGKEQTERYVIKCLGNKYILSPSNSKEEIKEYCKPTYH